MIPGAVMSAVQTQACKRYVAKYMADAYPHSDLWRVLTYLYVDGEHVEFMRHVRINPSISHSVTTMLWRHAKLAFGALKLNILTSEWTACGLHCDTLPVQGGDLALIAELSCYADGL